MKDLSPTGKSVLQQRHNMSCQTSLSNLTNKRYGSKIEQSAHKQLNYVLDSRNRTGFLAFEELLQASNDLTYIIEISHYYSCGILNKAVLKYNY